MYSKAKNGNAGALNQTFLCDEETAVKLRQKFRCKRALHHFMTNKGVSI